ncbi:MAG TPA: precorrin-3B C(17)-methyltransferase [Solirubrobacteraceae bacterium]|nr:precorrin-3B C(17)-methyltransferase [Solirubrobacteraceae bacterium]
MTPPTASSNLGRLFGVGVGPGDPELMTIKARGAIEAADVIAYPGAQHGRSVARSIAAPYLTDSHIELPLRYPVTTEETDHPGGYEGAISEFYDEAAGQLAAHLDEGRDVAVLCAGDPLLYGSYMYLHERLAHRYETTVIPGVTSFCAAAAAAGTPLVKRDDVLTIIPGTLPARELEARLRESEAAVVLKLGRTFAGVRDAVRRAGAAARAVYVERATSERERIAALEAVADDVPYMSLVLVPSPDRAAEPPAGAREAGGRVTVVGLGPAGREWLTPEADAALAGAEVLIGYETYLRRVPERPGQQRFATDNRAELDRARHALELAARGARVAVVSSGDPGIFAMAAAVLEAAEARPAGDRIEVRVLPGVSAMQAAAARVGAPLAHDFCVVSLSDQLKPWEVIERRIDAAGRADMVLALYNPASRTRREQLVRAISVLRHHRADATPVVVARAVGDPEESIAVTTLGQFDPAIVDMRTLLIIGASTTRTIPDGDGPPRVYTPRRYPA